MNLLMTFLLLIGFLCDCQGASSIFEGHKYTLITKPGNYTTGRQACRDIVSDLAVVTSQEEHNFILNFAGNYSASLGMSPQIWIGLFRTTEGSNDFQWVDGTPFVLDNMIYFQTWFGDQPNDNGATCVRIKLNRRKWGDKGCSSFYWAICESGIR